MDDNNKFIEDDDVMLSHAALILNSYMHGNRISRLTGIHTYKIYDIRKNRLRIEDFSRDELLRLNRVYHTHAFFDNYRNEDE